MRKAIEPADLEIYAKDAYRPKDGLYGYCIFARQISTGKEICLVSGHASLGVAIQEAEELERQVRAGKKFIRIP